MATQFKLKQIKPFNAETVTVDVAAKIMTAHWGNYTDADIKADLTVTGCSNSGEPFGVEILSKRTNIRFRIFDGGGVIISSIDERRYQNHNWQAQLIQLYLDLGFFAVDIITE